MHGCQNCILHVQTNNSKKTWCLERSLLFLSLLIFNQNFFGVLAEKYGPVVKTAFHVYRWSCRERRTNLLNNTQLFTLFWEFERQIYGDWWKLHARLWKLHSTCTKEQFKKSLMLGKKVYCFYRFWFLIKVFRSFCGKVSARWSNLLFTSTDDPSEKEEQISWITHKFFLRIIASFSRSLVWKLHARFSKLHSTCTKEQFEKKLMLGKKVYCFITFEIQSKLFGVSAEKFRHGGQKTAFHVKRWSFQEWTNLSNNAEFLLFFENSIVKSTEFGDNFMHGCQNCILHLQTNNSKKFDVWEKV